MLKKIMPMFFAFALVVPMQANNQEVVEEQEVKVAEVEATKLDDAALQEIIKAVEEALAEKSEAGSSSKKKTFLEQYKKEIIAACILVPAVIGGGVVLAARNDKLPRSIKKLLPKWKILKKKSEWSSSKRRNNGSYLNDEYEDGESYSQNVFSPKTFSDGTSFNGNKWSHSSDDNFNPSSTQ